MLLRLNFHLHATAHRVAWSFVSQPRALRYPATTYSLLASIYWNIVGAEKITLNGPDWLLARALTLKRTILWIVSPSSACSIVAAEKKSNPYCKIDSAEFNGSCFMGAESFCQLVHHVLAGWAQNCPETQHRFGTSLRLLTTFSFVTTIIFLYSAPVHVFVAMKQAGLQYACHLSCRCFTSCGLHA